ncbi:MAG: SdpI family protein [Propionibacteriaceae bacterium]|jgi:uncharacterized membrane protein|nr:SdpI family protein [Propionibacteriaceae bacterium]
MSEDDGGMVILTVTFVVTALILWGVFVIVYVSQGRAGAQPNHFVGVRLPSTMRDSRSWVAAHEALGPLLRPSAITVFPLCVVSLALLAVNFVAAAIVSGVAFTVATVWIVVGAVVSDRAAKRVQASSSDPTMSERTLR